MSIRLQKQRHETTLMSVRELARTLNVPDSRMENAIAQGVVRLAGTIGRYKLVCLNDDELEELRLRRTRTPEAQR